MSVISDWFGYKLGRNLSKFILVISAVAISTFAGTEFISKILNFDFGLLVRDYLALSFGIIIFLIKDDILNPPIIPFLDRPISKYVYYIALGLVGLAISTIEFDLLNKFLNITFLDFNWFVIRNIIAVGLLVSARIIHQTG